jgi:hypothetical protein
VKRPDLERWWWDSSGMNVVWRGFHSNRSKKGRGQIISPYYFRIDDFDPFTGGKKHAAKVASPFWRKLHRQDWAASAAAMWDQYFVHGRVMKAIDVNHLLPGRLRMQVDIHDGFLSGYAHPSNKGYEAFHGLNNPDRLDDFDHYGSEIALLYVITLAAAELEIFMRMSRRQPRLGLRDADAIATEVRDARLSSSYFCHGHRGQPSPIDGCSGAAGGDGSSGASPRCSTASTRSTRPPAKIRSGDARDATGGSCGTGTSSTTPTRSTVSSGSTIAGPRCRPASCTNPRSRGTTGDAERPHDQLRSHPKIGGS